MEKAMALFEEMHAAGLAQKPYGTASYLEQFSRKLQRTIVSPLLETKHSRTACLPAYLRHKLIRCADRKHTNLKH